MKKQESVAPPVIIENLTEKVSTVRDETTKTNKTESLEEKVNSPVKVKEITPLYSAPATNSVPAKEVYQETVSEPSPAPIVDEHTPKIYEDPNETETNSVSEVKEEIKTDIKKRTKINNSRIYYDT